MQVAISTKISLETAQALEAYLKATGRPKAHVVEEALRKFLESQNKEARPEK